MKPVHGKYLPSHIYRKGEFISMHSSKITKQERREIYTRARTHYSMDTRPVLKKIYDKSDMVIMKMGGGYSGKEYIKISKIASEMGYVAQKLQKDANQGYIYFATENVLFKHFDEMGILEEINNLPKAKLVNRIQKFLSPGESLPETPRVKLTGNIKWEGLIFANPEYMKRNNLPMGTKTTGPVKGLLVPSPFVTDCDIAISENENKIKLSAAKLSQTMMLRMDLVPEKTFSRNLKRKLSEKIGRNPRVGFDIASMLGMKIDPNDSMLAKVRRAFEGGCTAQEIVDMLFTYEDNAGEKKIAKIADRIVSGESIYIPEIWEHVSVALTTVLRKALQPNVKGIYGTALPMGLLAFYGIYNSKGLERKRGWLTRFPWTSPILTDVVVYQDCIFVDPEIWQCFGGDYDGDTAAVYDIDSIDGVLVWNQHKEFIKKAMKAPKKEEHHDDIRSLDDVIADQLDQHAATGKMFNRVKVMVDSARKFNKFSKMQLIELELMAYAAEVQPRIDGFKYKSIGSALASVEELMDKYACQNPHHKESKDWFNLIRGGQFGILDIVTAAKDAKPDSKSSYEAIAAVLKDWQWGGYEYEPEIKI